MQRPAGVGEANWIDAPFNRWAFRHVREVARTARIRRGDGVRNLERRPSPVGAIEFEFEGRRSTVDEMLAATYTDALIVAVDGVVVDERYFDGMRDHDTHLLMSVSKSLTATLAGTLIGQGAFAASDLVTQHLPQLAGTAWDGCTVQHLLDMRAGTDFDEDDYADPDSPGRLIEEVSDYVPRTRSDLPPDTATWIAELGNVRPHGDRFQYRSILTDVLAWVIEATTGERFPDAFSRHIWSCIGAEHDAEIVVDRSGFALAEGGICCTARDLLRFGLMVSEGGGDVVPSEWLARLRTPDPDRVAAYAAHARPSEPDAFYGDMWWVIDPVRGVYGAYGINGQTLSIDHSTGTVIVKLSTWPDRWDDRMGQWSEAGLAAIAENVRSTFR